jgi:hypothetical protein
MFFIVKINHANHHRHTTFHHAIHHNLHHKIGIKCAYPTSISTFPKS